MAALGSGVEDTLVRGPADPRGLALLIGSAIFMQALDSTIVIAALPQIGAALHQPVLRLDLAITSYIVGSAAALPLSGWLCDRVGPKPVFCLAIVGFILASALCAAANGLNFLVVARTLQGAAGAMLMPVGRVLLLRSAPKSQLIEAMTYLALPAIIGPLVGPPLGGFLATAASWRWLFLVNIPVGLIGLALVLWLVRDGSKTNAAKLDLVGAFVSAVALVGLTYGLELCAHSVTARMGLALVAIGLAAVAAYLLHARRRPDPVLDLTLFRIETFRISVVGGFLCRLSIGAAPYLLVLQLQIVNGLSAVVTGGFMLLLALGSLLMRTTASGIFRRFGFRRVLTFGGLVTGFSFASTSAFGRPGWTLFVLAGLLVAHGFARSIQISGLLALGFADASPSETSAASTLMSVMQLLAQAFGVAGATLILETSRRLTGARVIGETHLFVAYILLGGLAVISVLPFRRLAPDAGAHLLART